MLPGDQREWREKVIAKCEDLGVDETRRLLREGVFAGRKVKIISAWLAVHDDSAAAADRETEISIAREANSIAREANDAAHASNRRSTIAIVVAALAAAIAAANAVLG